MTKRYLTIIFIWAFFFSKAQDLTKPNEWKKLRMEVYGGIGVSNFLGELGGRNAIGKHYSPADLEVSLTPLFVRRRETEVSCRQVLLLSCSK